MTIKQILFLLIIFFNLSYDIHGQDTLVLCKRRNSKIELKIPLNEYDLKIKPIFGKRKKAIISDFKDSTFILKVFSFNKFDTSEQKRLEALRQNTTITNNDTIQKKLFEILYAKNETIKLNEIKLLTIDNYKRKEMKNFLRIIDIIGYTVLSGILIGIIVDNGNIFLTSMGLAAITSTIGIITQKRRINFTQNWTVKKVIRK